VLIADIDGRDEIERGQIVQLVRLPVSITSTVRGGSLLISSDCGG
jgi:hypothetical protein